jgi:hypothetical protein
MATIGDEAISLLNMSDVAISNISVNGCDYTLEFQNSSTAVTMKNITCSNITSTGNLMEPIFFSLSSNTSGYSNVTITNCVFDCHATLHDGGVVSIVSGAAVDMTGILFDGIVARNINSFNTNAKNWVNLQTFGAGTYSSITFRNCFFSGLSGSTRTADSGLKIVGQANNFMFNNMILKNIAGIGVQTTGIAATTTVLKNLTFDNVLIDTCTSHGMLFASTVTTHTQKEIRVINCKVLDCGTQGSSNGFEIRNSVAGTTREISLSNCRGEVDASANFSAGIRLDNSGAGTFDEIVISHPRMIGIGTFINQAGTPTDVHFTPVSGRGTDIASAATIIIPPDGTIFHVTGTTNITNGITVNSWDKGRQAVLMFESTPDITDTGTSVLAGDFTTAVANSTLTLLCNGTSWFEMARSVN